MDPFGDDLLDHGCFIGNTRTLDDFIGIQYLFFCVMTLFPFDVVVIQQFLVFVLDGSHV